MTKDDALRMMLGPFKAWRDVPGNEDVVEELKKIINAVEKVLAQPEQEPVAWPCHIIEADFSERTITLGMECGDYKVSAGPHWLSTTPPKENT
jgi:hypothetical protein